MTDIEEEQQENFCNCEEDDYGYDAYEGMKEEETVETATYQNNIYFSDDQLYDHILKICKLQIADIFTNLTMNEVLSLFISYKFDAERLKGDLGYDCDITKSKNHIVDYKKTKQIECLICLEKAKEDILACCASVCQNCLEKHLSQSITDWKLDLSCPVCQGKVYASALRNELFVQFRKRLIVKYMQSRLNYTQCLDCEKFIEFWKTKKIVECECNCEICHLCGGFAHRPLDCQTYKKWNSKIVDESRNLIYIQKNTKKCNNCGWFIEKNSGCNHMTCRMCRYQFCWLCMGDWKNHNSCSAFGKNGQIVEEKVKVTTTEDLSKLQFYGVRYQNFEQGQKYAKKMKSSLPDKIRLLSFLLDTPPAEFKFFEEAINTIIMTRRRVKCLYAYIFMAKLSEKEKQLLQYNLETTQTNLEGLTLTLEGILDTLNEDSVMNVSEVFALKHRIVEYKNNIYKFMGLILEDTEFKPSAAGPKV